MKERPIIMTGESVRAILDGHKTQTRRLIDLREFGPSSTRGYDWTFRDRRLLWQEFTTSRVLESKWCRFPVGARMWVKETWCLAHPDYHSEAEGERLGRPMRYGRWCHYAECDVVDDNDGRSPWRSPMFMPRWASRLTLEVTSVRVQRLQDISEEDARAEGCTGSDPEPAAEGGTIYAWHGRSSAPCPRAHYLTLWDRINAKRAPWASNPWVWAITFRMVP